MRGEIFNTLFGNIGLLFIAIYGLVIIFLKEKIMCNMYGLELQEGTIISMHTIGKRKKSLIFNKKYCDFWLVQSDIYDLVGKTIKIYLNEEIAIRAEKSELRKKSDLIICILSILYTLWFVAKSIYQIELMNLFGALFLFLIFIMCYPFALRRILKDEKDFCVTMLKDEMEAYKQELDLDTLAKAEQYKKEAYEEKRKQQSKQQNIDKNLIIFSFVAFMIIGIVLSILNYLS